MWAFRLFRAPSVCALISLSDGRIGFSEVTGLPSNSYSLEGEMSCASANITTILIGTRKIRVQQHTLSDIWLWLACALGWTVWLVSATRQSEPDPFLLEARSDFITTVHDNVLEVALGEHDCTYFLPTNNN
jgi:hypothetical protein